MTLNREILPYYNRELSDLQKLGAAFAKAHPKIAKQLNIEGEHIEDPHVLRLIEAIAFLNARVQRKFDDGLPESVQDLVSILYPHYANPIPSMAVVQFVATANADKPQTVPHNVLLETDPTYGEVCYFKVCYDTEILPTRINSAKLIDYYQSAPRLPQTFGAPLEILALELECLASDMQFSKLAPNNLRFFIKGGAHIVYKIYELIFNNVLAIGLANSEHDTKAVFLNNKDLKQVGFSPNEAMLPCPPQSFPAYRLLSEFFTFPEKFLFFDLVNLGAEKFSTIGNKLFLYFYLRQPHYDLRPHLSATNFAQGCSPVINLFPHRAEPVTLSNTQVEYPVIADLRRPDLFEVYTINKVTAISPEGEEIDCQPFYGLTHGKSSEHKIFWHAIRRDAVRNGSQDNIGTELSLIISDINGETLAGDDWTLGISTTCSNHNLPRQLFLGNVTPRLQFANESVSVADITWQIPPTAPTKPPLKADNQWRLVSHLTLNHIGLMAEDGSAIRELLKVYDFTEKPEMQMMVEGIVGIKTSQTTARLPNKQFNSFANGIEITVDVQESHFPQNQILLFGSVLNSFFARYCTINSFIKLVITTNNFSKVLHQWPPHTGSKTLI
jgi:type VI secretion system protein ImpG